MSLSSENDQVQRRVTRQVRIIFAPLILCAGCLGGFSPSDDPGDVDEVNSRSPRVLNCAVPGDGSRFFGLKKDYEENSAPIDWPTIVAASTTGELNRQLRKALTTRVGVDGGFALVELTPELVELGLISALRNQEITEGELLQLRSNAQRRLFRRSARTFAVVHRHEDFWSFASSEPTLSSERHGSGRIVYISSNLAAGITRNTFGVFMLEDRVCDTDGGYIVRMKFGSGGSRQSITRMFFQGADVTVSMGVGNDPLPYLADVLGPAQNAANADLRDPQRPGRKLIGSMSDMQTIQSFVSGILKLLFLLFR